jgi:predicted DNA-binding WGR domain protein
MLTIHRCDPTHMARFYSVSLQGDLLGWKAGA